MEDEKRPQRISQAAQNTLNISHGVKNILQAVKGGIEVVDYSLKTYDIERAKRGWEVLRKNLERIEKLVLDMLQYSSDSQLQIKPCNFNALVESAVNTLQPTVQQSQIKLNLSKDPDIRQVPLDSEKFYDVILNLTLNAIEAVDPQKGVINIVTQAKGEEVILQIFDNGPGITNTEEIFEPFHTTRAKVGTGLGLPIAKKIITQHNGKIEVESIPGQGSKFTVTIKVGS